MLDFARGFVLRASISRLLILRYCFPLKKPKLSYPWPFRLRRNWVILLFGQNNRKELFTSRMAHLEPN